jgi:hypothetical protein
MSHSSTVGSVLLYLNGIRLPCIAVSVTGNDGAPASASAQIPWHPILEGLGEEDLLQCSIFYLDQHYYQDPTYCLLFEGRLVGYSYSNNSTSESMSLSFESNMMILNDLSINFIGAKEGSKSTANKDYPNQVDIKSTGSKLLTTKYTGNKIKRPFDILENIIYAVSGEYRDSDSYIDKADSTMSKRVDELNRLAEKNYLRAYYRVLGDRKYKDLRGSDLDTFNQQVQQELLRTIAGGSGIPRDRYYREGQDVQTTVDRYISALVTKEVKSNASNYRDIVVSGFFSRYFRLTRFKEHWMCSPYFEGFPGDKEGTAKLGGGVFPLLRSKGASKYMKALVKRTGEKMGPQGRVFMLVKSLYSMMFYKMSEILAPPAYIASKYSLPERSLEDSLQEVRGKVDAGEEVDYSSVYSSIYDKEQHVMIGSYLTLPDAPYALPPSCNVIFPSQRVSISISNSTNATPTRVYYNRRSSFGKLDLQSKSPGYNYDAKRVGFPSVAAGLSQKAAGSSSKDLETLIFPEEYYRGPRVAISNVHPAYGSIQDFANSARFSESKTRSGPAASVYDPDPETVNIATESVEKASSKGLGAYGLYFLLAQKEYYNSRSSAKTASVSTLFNPYVVPGLPCAILSGDDSGMQYYGKIVNVSHSISNAGGSNTSVSVASLRHIKDDLMQVVANKGVTDIGPPDPIKEIRTLLQTIEGAEEYYRDVFKRSEVRTVVGANKSSVASIKAQILEFERDIAEAKEIIRAYTTGSETFIGIDLISYTLSTVKDSPSVSGNYPTSLKVIVTEEDKAEYKRKLEQWLDTYNTLVRELPYMESIKKSLEESLADITEKSLGTKNACAFDPKQFLGWWEGSKSRPDPINILEGDPDKYLRDGDKEAVWGVPTSSRLVGLPEVKQYFTDSNRAIHYNSRPVCTLEQFIDFYCIAGRGEAGFDLNGRGRGVRGHRRTHPTGAVYYDIIRSFIGGPGLQPGTTVEADTYASTSTEASTAEFDSNRDTLSPRALAARRQSSLTYIDSTGDIKEFTTFKPGQVVTLDDLPDSRIDWQKLLLDYVSVIESTATKREG